MLRIINVLISTECLKANTVSKGSRPLILPWPPLLIPAACRATSRNAQSTHLSTRWWGNLSKWTPSYPHLFIHPHRAAQSLCCGCIAVLGCHKSPSALRCSFARFLCRLNHLTIYDGNWCRDTSWSEVCQEPIEISKHRSHRLVCDIFVISLVRSPQKASESKPHATTQRVPRKDAPRDFVTNQFAC